MPDKVRVLLVDVYPLTHTAVQTILKETNDLHLIASINKNNKIAEFCHTYCPHIILMASNAIESTLLEALGELKRHYPTASVLFLLTTKDKIHIPSLMKGGAAGCIAKQSPSFRLLEAIRAVADGNIWLDPILLNDIFNSDSTPPSLTEREKAILKMLVAGKTDKEMAQTLQLSDRTIRRELDHLYLKLNTHTRAETAYKVGLINLLE